MMVYESILAIYKYEITKRILGVVKRIVYPTGSAISSIDPG